jgi:guanylate kinase
MGLGKLIIFSAPSGSGKTTLVRHLLSKPELKLAFSVSATSRPKRAAEEDGRDYYFLSPDEFRRRISEGDFLEWEAVYEDQYYGTLKSEVDRIHAEGKTVIFDVDVVGGLNIKKQFGSNALAIFVQPPSVKALEQRLQKRATESEESLTKRIAKAEHELTFANKFDMVVVNDDLETAKADAYRSVADFVR